MDNVSAVHTFSADDFDAKNLPFKPTDYARLKYGDDEVARRFGWELAESFFHSHQGLLLGQPCVVIPSPYNYVENAATIMTKHLVRRLNHLLVAGSGVHVDFATIQRKVRYSGDFGLLDAQARRELIGGDEFYLNEKFFVNKTLLLVDDIRITGAHEERLRGLLNASDALSNSTVHFAYYARLVGDETRNDVEAYLNSVGMDVDQFLPMVRQPEHHFIVRPIKWLMRMEENEFKRFLRAAPLTAIWKLYDGCLGEGYYTVPDYQVNFLALREYVIHEVKHSVRQVSAI